MWSGLREDGILHTGKIHGDSTTFDHTLWYCSGTGYSQSHAQTTRHLLRNMLFVSKNGEKNRHNLQSICFKTWIEECFAQCCLKFERTTASKNRYPSSVVSSTEFMGYKTTWLVGVADKIRTYTLRVVLRQKKHTTYVDTGTIMIDIFGPWDEMCYR